MASITIEFQGTKHSMKAAPMKPLADVVQQICSKLGLQKPAECSLLHNGKPLELSTPFRFLNLPSNAKVSLATPERAARQLGVIESRGDGNSVTAATAPAAPAATPAAAPAAGSHPPVPDASAQLAAANQIIQSELQASSLAADHSMGAQHDLSNLTNAQHAGRGALETGAVSQHPVPAGTVVDSTAPSMQAVPAQQQVAAQHGVNQPQHPQLTTSASAMTSSAAPQSAQITAQPSQPPQPPAATEPDELYVFLADALRISSRDDDSDDVSEDDAFFEFTAEDFHRAMASFAAARRDDATILKTKALRDAEESSRAARFKKCVIRLHFPDGVVLQTAFSPTAPLHDMLRFAQRSVLPQHADSLQLFITPPKHVLRGEELRQSFYKAGFVPAANVHVGFGTDCRTSSGAERGSYLQPSVLQLLAEPPAAALSAMTRGDRDAARDGAAAQPSQNGGDGNRARRAAEHAAAGRTPIVKKPKWMKV